MVLKIFKAVWFLSVLTVLANLLYIYAGMQQEGIIIQEMERGSVKISRELFFYCSLVIVALVNFMVYLTSKAFAKQEAFRTWFHGLIITVNIFFIITFSLIGTYNSSEVFDYSRIGFAIYVLFQYVLCLAGTSMFLFNAGKFSLGEKAFITGLVSLTVVNCGVLFEQRSWVKWSEWLRVIGYPVLLAVLTTMNHWPSSLYILAAAYLIVSSVWFYSINKRNEVAQLA